MSLVRVLLADDHTLVVSDTSWEGYTEVPSWVIGVVSAWPVSCRLAKDSVPALGAVVGRSFSREFLAAMGIHEAAQIEAQSHEKEERAEQEAFERFDDGFDGAVGIVGQDGAAAPDGQELPGLETYADEVVAGALCHVRREPLRGVDHVDRLDRVGAMPGRVRPLDLEPRVVAHSRASPRMTSM